MDPYSSSEEAASAPGDGASAQRLLRQHMSLTAEDFDVQRLVCRGGGGGGGKSNLNNNERLVERCGNNERDRLMTVLEYSA